MSPHKPPSTFLISSYCLAIIVALLGLTLSTRAEANMARPRSAYGAELDDVPAELRFQSPEESPIQMDKEEVFIQVYRDYAVVKGRYWMKNLSDRDVKLVAGYPSRALSPGDNKYALDANDIEHFKVVVNGRAKKTWSVEDQSWLYWDEYFPANTTTLVEVYFTHRTQGYGFVEDSATNSTRYIKHIASYVLETGATWGHPINEATILLQLQDDVETKDIAYFTKKDFVGYDDKQKTFTYKKAKFDASKKDNIEIAFMEETQNSTLAENESLFTPDDYILIDEWSKNAIKESKPTMGSSGLPPPIDSALSAQDLSIKHSSFTPALNRIDHELTIKSETIFVELHDTYSLTLRRYEILNKASAAITHILSLPKRTQHCRDLELAEKPSTYEPWLSERIFVESEGSSLRPRTNASNQPKGWHLDFEPKQTRVVDVFSISNTSASQCRLCSTHEATNIFNYQFSDRTFSQYPIEKVKAYIDYTHLSARRSELLGISQEGLKGVDSSKRIVAYSFDDLQAQDEQQIIVQYNGEQVSELKNINFDSSRKALMKKLETGVDGLTLKTTKVPSIAFSLDDVRAQYSECASSKGKWYGFMYLFLIGGPLLLIVIVVGTIAFFVTRYIYRENLKLRKKPTPENSAIRVPQTGDQPSSQNPEDSNDGP